MFFLLFLIFLPNFCLWLVLCSYFIWKQTNKHTLDFLHGVFGCEPFFTLVYVFFTCKFFFPHFFLFNSSPSFFPLLFLIMITCWSFGHGSWCSLSSPFYIFLIDGIASLVSWLWFFVFIIVTFFFFFFSWDRLVGLLVVVINVNPSYMFFMIVIMLLFFWLWFLTFIVITVLRNCDHLFGLLVVVFNIHCHHHYLLIYSS
jgi:hypothetical protein